MHQPSFRQSSFIARYRWFLFLGSLVINAVMIGLSLSVPQLAGMSLIVHLLSVIPLVMGIAGFFQHQQSAESLMKTTWRNSIFNYLDNQGWSTWLSKLLFLCAIILALVNFVIVMGSGFTVWRAIIVPALWIFGTYRLMIATERNPDAGKALLTLALFAVLVGSVILSLVI